MLNKSEKLDPHKHSLISVNKRGGVIEDYYKIHSFIDSTKELCSDNRHRILHNLWGVRRIVIPIFGRTIVNSDGREILVKEICEDDHILPDYNHRFLPNLSDFVDAISNDYHGEISDRLNGFYENCNLPKDVQELMLSPLALTGRLKSLLFTHNSWFVNEILPRIFEDYQPLLLDFELSGSGIFQYMDYLPWMDNGIIGKPKSSIEF